jgi:hypothetical protein
MTAYDLYHELIVQGFSLSVNGGKLDLAPSSQLTDNLRAQIRTYKADLMALLASNDHTPTANRYAHLITCHQCEHLTLTGHCRVKPQYKPQPEAMRDCASFETIQGERVSIANAPYSASELNALLSRYEKKLFDHLLKCKQCDFEAARYCAEVFTTGNSYDALLLVFDDAKTKREALFNTVIRALISGRSVFVSLDHANIGAPQQTPVKPLVYGNSNQCGLSKQAENREIRAPFTFES